MAKAKTKKVAKAAPKKGKQIEFHRDYRPGKGLSMNLDMVEAVFKVSDLLVDLEVQETDEARESILTRAFGDPIEVDLKWGKKWLVVAIESRANNEFRVCIVIRNGEIRVDAREWYNPNKD